MTSEENSLHGILESARTIAVVGCSSDPGKKAYEIPRNLHEAGYRIIPVNPTVDMACGERACASLDEVHEQGIDVDVVDVFRPASEAPEIARAAVRIGARALWLQEGIRSPEARAIAEGAGLDYVEDHCIGKAHRRFVDESGEPPREATISGTRE